MTENIFIIRGLTEVTIHEPLKIIGDTDTNRYYRSL